jgi:uncharacterized protein (TIGR00369 family)
MTDFAERRYGVATAEEAGGLTGLQFLQKLIDGALPAPPMAKTLGFEIVEAGDGFAAFEGDTSEALLNPAGIVHGGWVLTLVDSAATCAAMTGLPAGVGATTIETKVNFLRPLMKDSGRVRAEARVIGKGRRILTAEARVTDAKGRIVAHGTSTVMALDKSQ